MPRADCITKHLSYSCRDQVVWGFGRGYKQLANFPEQVVDNLPADISSGIYYGWASAESRDGQKMVVSIRWNPYYENTKKSMETHTMHTFKEHFYGEILSVAIVESLISAIQDLPELLKLKGDNFFQVSKSKIMNGH
uniref:riboflavin kinase n=1 Tax=Gorilla gorilla gorilla TaxID=9595 RepID=G3S864_GORGO